jgi:hypothetical protein
MSGSVCNGTLSQRAPSHCAVSAGWLLTFDLKNQARFAFRVGQQFDLSASLDTNLWLTVRVANLYHLQSQGNKFSNPQKMGSVVLHPGVGTRREKST